MIFVPQLKISQSPRKEEPQSPPPPTIYPNHHAQDVYLSFQFPLLKKTLTMRNFVLVNLKQYPNNIENRP